MDQTTRLSNILTDLLSLSRLESAGLNLMMKPTALRDVAKDSIDALLPASENKNIHIESQVLDEPIEVLGDREALFQSVNSLLDNAIKYNTVNGHVQLLIQKLGGNAVIDVQDTGIGIEPLEQHRIFERFYRVDRARSRQLGGTGLGLSIVKHTALAHGGQLSVESTPDKVSTFKVTIPLIKPSSK